MATDFLPLESPLGLIAGNGIFPLEFARAARERGLAVIAVAHRGETDERIEQEVSRCTWVQVGQLGKIINALKKGGAKQVVFAGGISRVKIFRGIKLDMRALALVCKLRSVRDDVLLRGAAQEIEQSGMRVVSAAVLLDKYIPEQGYLTTRRLTAREAEDALIGWEASQGVGAFDIGQTVVVSQGVVVAVEAVEGTDATIHRAGELSGKGGVVVKTAKPQQDLRFDLPTVGNNTITTMSKAGASALVLQAKRALILNPDEVIRMAEEAGISILVVASEAEIKRS